MSSMRLVIVTGLSGAYIKIGSATLQGMSLAALVGMVLGLTFYILDRFKLTNDYE